MAIALETNPSFALDLFRAADWTYIRLQLAAHAIKKVRRLSWHTPEGLPGGAQPEDLALGAIQKTLDGLLHPDFRGAGVRHWNPDVEPDLLNYLKSVIDSEVSNLVTSDEHRLTQYPSVPHEGGAFAANDRSETSPFAASLGAYGRDAEQLLDQRESGEEAQHDFDGWMRELRAACAGDADEHAVLDAYHELAGREDGPLRAAQIARELGWAETRVRNVRRRIERKTRLIRARAAPAISAATAPPIERIHAKTSDRPSATISERSQNEYRLRSQPPRSTTLAGKSPRSLRNL